MVRSRWISFALASAAFLGVISTSGRAREMPSNCPPESPKDAICEVRIRHFDADSFSPTGYNFVDYGPALGSLSPPERVLGSLNPKLQRTKVSVEQLDHGSLGFSLSNTTEVMAKRVDGHHFGNGGRIIVDAWVRGPTGTPYYVAKHVDGVVETQFPQGLGRADSTYNSQGAASVNGSGLSTVPVHVSTLSTGLSSFERTFDGVTYSHAGQHGFDVTGIIWQSIDFCFPFTPCPTMHYWARGDVTGNFEVGIGHPTCTGTLQQEWCMACSPAAVGYGVQRSFAVSADIVPANGSTSCSCCEYRQYIRRASSEYAVGFLGVLEPPQPWPLPPNAAGENKGCDTWAEDTAITPTGVVSYGRRLPPVVAQPYSAYVDVDRSPAQICASSQSSGNADGCHFESRDVPQFNVTTWPSTVRKYVEFEGRVISKAGCTPGVTHDVVLARKRWTMCCEKNVLGTVTECTAGSLPPSPPHAFSSSKPIGPRHARLLVAQANSKTIVFAVVQVTPQTPLGYGAVSLSVPGVTAIDCDDGPIVEHMLDGSATYAYFPFLLSAPVSGSFTATIDIFGAQATWQIDLTSLGGPLAYCTPGTSVNGCTAVISAIGTPSAAASSGFALAASGAPGQRGALVFYGANGRNSIPWKPGSTSFLCVKSPTQRMLYANTGGTAGACDGGFATDFLAFVAANPASIGHPLVPGATFDAQAWYRDPQAPGTTNLSNAIEWTMSP